MKRVLMVAFQFPPFAGSSAIQRTLRFVQHLPQYGWQAVVLSANPIAYETTSDDLVSSIPADVLVERALALDTARHLSIARRYPGFLARPDRWCTWRFAAVAAGRRIIEKHRPAAIWSTYPIATAHMIGSRLSTSTRLPWLADFRDPMAQEGYPADPLTWRSFKAIEDDAVRRAKFAVFTTPGAAQMYRTRNPELPADRFQVIENGYDEESFDHVEEEARAAGPLVPGGLTLLHSGAIYESERDPTQLFAALGSLKRSGRFGNLQVRVRFRAAGSDRLLKQLAELNDVQDIVELAPAISYDQALREMVRADALLILQASNCNQQIPAKLYEYLRAGRPVIALTDPAGDTAAALRAAGVEALAPLDSAAKIEQLLGSSIDALKCGKARAPDGKAARGNSRARRAAELAELLERATG